MSATRFFCTLLLTSAIAGCDQVSNLFGPTTVKAFDECIAKGKDSSLSRSAVRTACLSKLQSTVPDVVEGKGGYERCLPEDDYKADPKTLSVSVTERYPKTCEKFGGTLSNNSKDYVVTSVTILLRNEKGETEKNEIGNLWIEYGKSERFDFDVKHKPTRKDEADRQTGKFSWTTEGHKGVRASF